MSTIDEMLGINKTAAAQLTAGDVYLAAKARAAQDLISKVAMLKMAEDPEVAQVLEEALASEGAPEAIVDEPAPMEGEADEGALVEALLDAFANPEVADDVDREAMLESASAIEDQDKAAGLNLPTVRDYVAALMQISG